MKLNHYLYCCSIGILLIACHTQNILVQKKTDTPPYSFDSSFKYQANYEYTIRKDDKISLSLWDHDNLSVGSVYGIYNSNEVYGKWLLVDARGNITVPKLGNFHIAGMTVIQAEDSLKTLYSKWVVNPVIEVKVLNKEIVVMGELKNPGRYTVEKDNNTLLEMIAQAGDFEFYANKKKVTVLRQSGPHVKSLVIDLTQFDPYLQKNIQLIPGDIVIVPSRKNKDFDKRVSTIIPFTSATTAAAILFKAF